MRANNNVVYYCSECGFYYRNEIKLTRKEEQSIEQKKDYMLGTCSGCVTKNKIAFDKKIEPILQNLFLPFTSRH